MNEHISLWDEIVRRNPKSVDDLRGLYTANGNTNSFNNQVLVYHRSFFIRMKARLSASIIAMGDRKTKWWHRVLAVLEIPKLVRTYPEITKQNCTDINTKATLEIVDEFFQYENNPGRDSIFRTIFRLGSSKCAYDKYYADRRDVLLEAFIKVILQGKWEARGSNSPDPRWWNEPKPYGGENSIISALLKHREDIITLLGEEWQYLKEGEGENECPANTIS